MSLKDTFNLKIKTDIHKISMIFWIMLVFIIVRSAWVLFNHAFDVPLTDPDFPWENIFLTLSALVIAVVALKGWFETFKVLFEMNENLEAIREQEEQKK